MQHSKMQNFEQKSMKYKQKVYSIMENNTIRAVIYNHMIKVIGTEITVNKSGETIGEGEGRERKREREACFMKKCCNT